MKSKIVILSIFLCVFAYAKTGNWVAKVNNKTISEKEFKDLFNTQLDVMALMSGGKARVDVMRANKQYQQRFLENYVVMQLVLKKIRAINKRKRFINEARTRKLAQKVAKYIEDQLYVKEYLTKVLLPKVGKVSNKQVEQVYNKYKAKFKKVSVAKAAKIIRERIKLQKAQIRFQQLSERMKNEASIKINYSKFEK